MFIANNLLLLVCNMHMRWAIKLCSFVAITKQANRMLCNVTSKCIIPHFITFRFCYRPDSRLWQFVGKYVHVTFHKCERKIHSLRVTSTLRFSGLYPPKLNFTLLRLYFLFIKYVTFPRLNTRLIKKQIKECHGYKMYSIFQETSFSPAKYVKAGFKGSKSSC